ncbi:hypothetical protein [Actinophytocola glycyrrhizae]|uniref:Uncharacterized protein n=1 Tax=Actinophytocola glycyrrhizae TaxID=2044873 RepID=A0ABV9RVW2_9PSEU
MAGEFPAGLSSSDIEFLMRNNDDVVSMERVDGAKALWKIAVSVEGAEPVQVLADNGINDIYFQALVQIDMDHVGDALSVLQPYATVGLAIVGEALFMRSAFYVSFSNMHALSNTLRAVALAYTAYRQVIA